MEYQIAGIYNFTGKQIELEIWETDVQILPHKHSSVMDINGYWEPQPANNLNTMGPGPRWQRSNIFVAEHPHVIETVRDYQRAHIAYDRQTDKLTNGLYELADRENYIIGRGREGRVEIPGLNHSHASERKPVYFFIYPPESLSPRLFKVEAAESCYGLAVLFKSDTQLASAYDIATKTRISKPADIKNPISMALAFSRGPLVPDKKGNRILVGVKTRQKMETGSDVHIKLYDLAEHPKPVKSVSITFKNPDGSSASTIPFSDPHINGTLSFSNPTANNRSASDGDIHLIDSAPADPAQDTPEKKEKRSSVACNTLATRCYGLKKKGEATAEDWTHYHLVNTGKYELEVTVTLEDGTVFFADPEVDIEGAG